MARSAFIEHISDEVGMNDNPTTTLAQVVLVIVKMLVQKGIIDEDEVDGYDLEYIMETLVDTLGADD